MEAIELAIDEFKTALLEINRIKANEIIEKLYKNDKSFSLLETIAIGALEKIGEGWENGTISLSQVYMSGIICEELIEKYLPEFDIERKNTPKMAITVLDHHALGKRIVYSVLRAGGFDVMDFGQGPTVDELVDKTIQNNIEILLISTLMLPSALRVKEVIDKLRDKQFKGKIIVGGAPFRMDSSLWQAVGADADGKNASDIIRIINTLLKGEE